MRIKDFRSLAEAEVMTYEHYLNAPHQDKEWFDYFLNDFKGYRFFTVFLIAEAKGKAVKINDIYSIFDTAKDVGQESIKKKIQEGVSKGVIHRHTCDEDQRTKQYHLNDDLIAEIGEYLVYAQELRMLNILDAFEDVYSMNIIKSFQALFSTRFGKNIATGITRTLTAQSPKDNIFKKEVSKKKK
tara:strand:+ start:396 stop:950 length:555 start_codon:yes stop_codon:yes gene_type:complete